MSEFWEQYKHPNWQKKRLEVMELAGFRGQQCYSDDKTLNVHHRYYWKKRKVWDYEAEELICLCEECHEQRHKFLDSTRRLLGFLDQYDLEQVSGYVKSRIQIDLAGPRNMNLSIEFDGWGEAAGICEAYGIEVKYEYGEIPPVLEVMDKTGGKLDYETINAIRLSWKESKKFDNFTWAG